MARSKLQLSIEFMMVFSFVLVVFTFLFALVATQRAQTLNSQEFEQGQLVAQSVAAQLDRALQAGNGYYAAIPITSALGTLNYKLAITKGGAVVVNTTINKQVTQAISYSSVKQVVSNPSFIPAGLPTNAVSYYLMPIANGTLTIQNSFGTICVDYACPTTSNTATNVSMSEQVVHAANFNGQSSYIQVNNPFSTSWYFYWHYGSANVVAAIVGSTVYSSTTLHPNVWSHVCFTYLSGSGTLNIYANGAPAGSGSATGGSTLSVCAWIYPTSSAIGDITSSEDSTNYALIGARNPTTNLFQGSISNVQIYNIALSSSQVSALYAEGITGSPLAGAGNIGWWPLNGNANDYSGNGNNGNVIESMMYTTVAQLSAKVTNPLGQPLANALVGFTTTLGNLTKGQVAINYTNGNGIATAFLDQQGNSGQALVKATAYNGNTALQGNLVSWYPLNLDQGSTVPDLSGNGNNGAMLYTSWSDPNYVAGFDGQSSYISTFSNNFPTGSSAYSVFAWVYLTSNVPTAIQAIDYYGTQGTSYATRIFSTVGQTLCFFGGSDTFQSTLTVPLNTWTLVGVTYQASSTQVTIYMNGQSQIGTLSGSTALNTPSGTINYVGGNPTYLWWFPGRIANVQMYSTALSANQVQQLYPSGISSPPIAGSGLVGWWPLNGNANDYTSNNNNGAIYGNLNFASTSSIPSPNANATSMFAGGFNGISSQVTVASTAIPNAATLIAWIYPYNVIGESGCSKEASGCISIMGYSPASAEYDLWLYLTNGQLGGTAYSTTYPMLHGGTTITANNWYQVAMTASNTLGTLSLYINGVNVGTNAIVSQGFWTGGNPEIGNLRAGQTTNFNGLISNVQLYNSTLNANQIRTSYSEGIGGLPLTANLIGWWPLNGNANDYSMVGNNGTASNVVYPAIQTMGGGIPTYSLGSYGANFNGQSSYVTFGNSINPGFGSFTVEGWAYATNYTYPRTRIPIGSYTSSGSGLPGWGIDDAYTAGAITIYFSDGTNRLSTSIPCDPGYKPTDTLNRWAQVVVVFNRTSGKAIAYVNGVQQSTQVSIAAVTGNVFNSYAGELGLVAGWYLSGSMADVQLYNAALNANQIKQLYQSQMPPSASAAVPLSWVP